MKLKISTIQIIVLLTVICLPTLLHAEPGFPDDVPDEVPIDGGLSLLVAAGVGYGIKKIKRNNGSKK